MFRCVRTLASSARTAVAAPVTAAPAAQAGAAPATAALRTLKLDSTASHHLYAVFRLHNMPYLVTKGDKVYLPYKLKHAAVGDLVVLNDVSTLGLPNYTYNNDAGIDPSLYRLRASVVEITREPYYEVYRKKQRCRRLKTFPVEPHQTVLAISELALV